MQILKCIRSAKVPRWTTLVPFLCYLLFITFILNLSFPLRSTKDTTTLIVQQHQTANEKSIIKSKARHANEEHNKYPGTKDEHKFVQRNIANDADNNQELTNHINSLSDRIKIQSSDKHKKILEAAFKR